MREPIIVLIDDIPEFLTTFEANLKSRYGGEYAIESYEDSESALEAITEAKEEGEEVALVIADHQMDGMKGVDLLIGLMRRHPETKRLLLTGEAQAPDVMKGVNSGAIQQYVRKEHMDEKDFDVFLSINSLLDTYQLERLAAAQNKTIEEIAKDFHMHTLPSRLPVVAGYAFARHYIPMEVIGGDFFDVFEIGGGRYVVLCGDVSGHGSSAALIAKLLIDNIRTDMENHSSPSRVLGNTNELFLKYQDRVLGRRLGQHGKFCTLFYGVLDTNSHTLLYSNAGHPSPIYIGGQNRVGELFDSQDKCNGFPLGSTECEYKEASSSVESGTKLLLYTDGLVEQMNSQQQLFKGNLGVVLQRHSQLPISNLLEELKKAYDKHRGVAPVNDDLTLFGIARE